MEVSALRYQGGIGLHGRTPLLRLQSDERLIVLVRRGSTAAFEVLVSRYNSRLLAFCRHLLGSKEDAEDVLQEVFAAAFNAIVADDRPINVRPWLYRIARNRSLNHLRRAQAIGVDSMDIHFSEHGATTADKVHDREQFRLLVRDIQGLPETQRTALVLREMDALSYEQIAEAMDTTVPGVKSLLVRARISLAEAAEARQLSCEEVRVELAEVAEGLHKRPSALVRRHLRACNRCETFQTQLKHTNKALAALLPIGPLALLRKLFIVHLGHSAGTGSGATAGAAGATSATTGAGASGVAAGQAAAVAGTASSGAAFGSAGSLISAGAGALASKTAAGLAAAALVTGAAVEATHITPHHHASSAAAPPSSEVAQSGGAALPPKPTTIRHSVVKRIPDKAKHPAPKPTGGAATSSTAAHATTASTATASKPKAKHLAKDATGKGAADAKKTAAGQTTPVYHTAPVTHIQPQPEPTVVSENDPTVLSSATGGTSGSAPDTGSASGSDTGGTTDASSPSTGTSCAPTTDSMTTPDPTTTTGPAGAPTSTSTGTGGTSTDPTSTDPTSTDPTSTDLTSTNPTSTDPTSTTPSDPSANGGAAPPADSSPQPDSGAGCAPSATPGP